MYSFEVSGISNTNICNTQVQVGFMVFNATFNNSSVISWRSVLLVEGNLSQVTEHFYHKGCIEHTSPWTGFELTTFVMIGTDCTDSCKSNYHTITTTTTTVIHSDIWYYPLCKLKIVLTCLTRTFFFPLIWNNRFSYFPRCTFRNPDSTPPFKYLEDILIYLINWCLNLTY